MANIARTLRVGRTLPRVRELKQARGYGRRYTARRTLPRVRELKRPFRRLRPPRVLVAPFPGCVN